MRRLRGFIVCVILMMEFASAQNGQTTSSDSLSRRLIKSDSLSVQIRTYESIVAELQRRPTENTSLAHIMTQLGNLYSAREDYPKAIYVYMRSIFLRQFGMDGNAHEKSVIAWQMVEVGNSFYRLHDYKLAEHAYRNAARYFESANDHQGLITAINNIGLCRYHSGNYVAALPVFMQMLEFSKGINDIPRIYSSTIYIGMSYGALGNYKEAIRLLEGLQVLELQQQDLDLEEFRVFQLGEIYMQSGDTVSAIRTFEQLTGKPLDPEDTYYNAMVNARLASYSLHSGQHKKAIEYALKAYELLQTQQHLSLLTEVNAVLYQSYRAIGDYKSALMYMEEYTAGTNKLNQREVQSFVSDYNKKMESLAISRELQYVQEQNQRMMTEKSNQKNLSIFLIIIAVLLLVMLFTARGFDARIQLLLDHVRSYDPRQRWMLLLLLGLYFVAFYYFFIPVENANEIRNLNVIQRILPGLIAYGVTVLVILSFYSAAALKRPVKNWYIYSLYAFGTAFISVLVAEFSHFYISGFGGINFLLSLSLIVLASFIVPLYMFILVVEKLIIKHIEAISQSMNRDIDLLKQQPGPAKELITLQSEKTSGKITFDIAELLAVEAQGNYCMFFISREGTILKKMLHITMKAIEENLVSYDFIVRCHKSFLVNIRKIEKVSGNSRGYFLHLSNEVEPVPVSRGYQKDVMTVIRKFKDGNS